MFQQKGWQGKERQQTKPKQSQGGRHCWVLFTPEVHWERAPYARTPLFTHGTPRADTVREMKMVCCCMLGAGELFWGFSLLFLSFPFLLLVKHLHARSSPLQGACADGFMWLPKGSRRFSGASKCGWGDLFRSKMLLKESKTPVNMRQQEQSTWKGNSSSLLSLEGAGNHDSLQPDPTSSRGPDRDLQVPSSTLSP